MLEFQQLFAKERPKPRFTSKIFENFLIYHLFQAKFSKLFANKSWFSRRQKKNFGKFQDFGKKFMYKTAVKPCFAGKIQGGAKKRSNSSNFLPKSAQNQGLQEEFLRNLQLQAKPRFDFGNF